MRRLCIIATLALVAGGAGLVAAEPSESPTARAAKPAIAIRGNVSGLYPGATKRLRLRLRNRSHRRLTVTRIRARVVDPEGRCRARALRARPKRLHRLVPARSSARVRYRIRMAPDVANACQGKRFPLRYRARARR